MKKTKSSKTMNSKRATRGKGAKPITPRKLRRKRPSPRPSTPDVTLGGAIELLDLASEAASGLPRVIDLPELLRLFRETKEAIVAGSTTRKAVINGQRVEVIRNLDSPFRFSRERDSDEFKRWQRVIAGLGLLYQHIKVKGANHRCEQALLDRAPGFLSAVERSIRAILARDIKAARDFWIWRNPIDSGVGEDLIRAFKFCRSAPGQVIAVRNELGEDEILYDLDTFLDRFATFELRRFVRTFSEHASSLDLPPSRNLMLSLLLRRGGVSGEDEVDRNERMAAADLFLVQAVRDQYQDPTSCPTRHVWDLSELLYAAVQVRVPFEEDDDELEAESKLGVTDLLRAVQAEDEAGLNPQARGAFEKLLPPSPVTASKQ